MKQDLKNNLKKFFFKAKCTLAMEEFLSVSVSPNGKEIYSLFSYISES